MGLTVKHEIDSFWKVKQKLLCPREWSTEEEKELSSLLCRRWPGWKVEDMRKLADPRKHDQLRENMRKLHLGKLPPQHSIRRSNPSGSRLQKFKLKSQSLGVRQSIEADERQPKSLFFKFWQMVKIWHSFERMMGHNVDATDIYQEFVDVVGREIQILERAARIAQLSKVEEMWVETMKGRLERLSLSYKYRMSYTERLMSWMGARFGIPSKRSNLSREQEEIRWQMTVQGFDGALWRAAFR